MDLVAITVGGPQALAVVQCAGRYSRERHANRGAGAWVAASFVASALLLRSTPPGATWPFWCQGTLLVGFALAMTSLRTLGRSFGVLPAARRLVTRGPYRFVRPPAYLGETIMMTACWAAIATSSPTPQVLALSTVLLVGAGLAVAFRVCAEERVLEALEPWPAYVSSTQYRMVPGLW